MTVLTKGLVHKHIFHVLLSYQQINMCRKSACSDEEK